MLPRSLYWKTDKRTERSRVPPRTRVGERERDKDSLTLVRENASKRDPMGFYEAKSDI